MDAQDWLVLLAILVCLALSFFFSGSETALTAFSRARMLRMEKAGNRKAAIVNRLRKSDADIPTLVSSIYSGLDPRLTKAAGMSVLAHLEDLVARGAVATDGPASIAGHYRLAG